MPRTMYSLDSLKIDLKGLVEDVTVFDFKLGDDYFAGLDGSEVKRGCVDVRLVVSKPTAKYYEMDFTVTGEVTIKCDRCLNDMQQPISTEGHLMAKLGEEYSEEDDIVTVDENEGMLDTSWFIYEFIALSIPLKHVHEPGKCDSAMIALLEQHSATRSSDGMDEQAVDPRWSGLEKLKNNIKD